ncbi:MAG: AraC family transcriptional regulator [Defluviitaleaceae bacterium]|nr:AraC family transcriptional regulator [Defluviitaleaceae bacterium]
MLNIAFEEIMDKMSVRFLYYGHDKHAKGDAISLSFQDYDLIYNPVGSTLAEVNGTQYRLDAAEAILLTPGTALKLRTLSDAAEQMYCHFIPEVGEAVSLRGNLPAYKVPARHRDLLKLYGDHFPLFLQDDMYGRLIVKSVLKNLLCGMILESPENQNAFMPGSAAADMQPISAVLKYMDEHACETLSIKDLAAKFHFNDTYFCRYFKKYLGVSPKQYMMRLKMEAARRMMLAQSLSIKETAVRVGINDPFLFSKQFKRFFHVSPTDFKSKNS